VLHVAFGIRSRPGADWIVEGLAEYYTVELLNRSGGLSAERTRRAFASLAEWAEDVDVLCHDPSTGPQTALAVTLLAALDIELRSASGNLQTLDDVLAILLATDERVGTADLIDAATSVLGERPKTLRAKSLPGCDTRESNSTASLDD
jgi:predicted metalloprotease with PDZ domain